MEMDYCFTIEKNYEGTRMDSVLSLLLTEASRSYIVKLIEQGRLTVNGKVETSKKYKVKEGDVIRLEMPEPELLKVEAEDIPLDIVYEDDDLLVVNKPRGMVVHPAQGNYTGTLVNALMYHCKDRLSSINGVIRPGIVHRIDKDTSGLLMVAKNDKAHESLSEQLRVHSINRRYVALVYDNITKDEGTIDLPIGRDPNNRLKKKVNGESPREAITHFEVLERFGKYTLLKLRLETGRTHQIRVHMSSIHHPLLGDPVYGREDPKFKNLQGQLLHAKSLGFIHPTSGQYMEFDSELPPYFVEVLKRVKKL